MGDLAILVLADSTLEEVELHSGAGRTFAPTDSCHRNVGRSFPGPDEPALPAVELPVGGYGQRMIATHSQL